MVFFPKRNEPSLEEVKLRVFKFNNLPRPVEASRNLVITNFGEFGCESIALMYCIPAITRKYPQYYTTAVGWYGREYLYRHLVDEYWELGEEHQWLREHSYAFKNKSKAIAKLQKVLNNSGVVIGGDEMGHMCLGCICQECKHYFGSDSANLLCPKCKSNQVHGGILADVGRYRPTAVKVPLPGSKAMNAAKKYLGPNPVGIFARGRKTYGRNLPSSFYVQLIELLRRNGHTPIWLGEKQSTQPCPVEDVVDFSRTDESKDLELTLAIISQLNFTIQFWTASTRLASMVGTPWILFESPDQIIGQGQEGLRISLTTEPNKKKLVLTHFLDTLNDPSTALALCERSIKEIKENNWADVVGLVSDPESMRKNLSNSPRWKHMVVNS